MREIPFGRILTPIKVGGGSSRPAGRRDLTCFMALDGHFEPHRRVQPGTAQAMAESALTNSAYFKAESGFAPGVFDD